MASAKERSLFGKESDAYDEDSKHCQPCFLVGSSISADSFCIDCREFLCKKCATHHKVLGATKDHVHVKANEANRAKLTAVKDKCSKKCSEHTDKSVKYFCKDHSQLGCTVCFMLEHKMCRDVEHIQTAATSLEDHAGFKLFDERLKNLNTAYKTSIVDIQKSLKLLQADERRVQQAFKDFREEMNSALDTLQSHVLFKAKNIKDQETKRLDTLLEKLANSQTRIDAMVKDLNLLLSNGKRCDAYVLAKTDFNKLLSLEVALATTTEGQTFQRFQFEANADLHKSGALGKLLTISGGPVISWSVPSSTTSIIAEVPPLATARNTTVSTHSKDDESITVSPTKQATASAPTTVTKDNTYRRGMTKNIKVGDRVRRGRDWLLWKDEDGGPGALGTVEDKCGGFGGFVWKVRWDNDNTGSYSMGVCQSRTSQLIRFNSSLPVRYGGCSSGGKRCRCDCSYCGKRGSYLGSGVPYVGKRRSYGDYNDGGSYGGISGGDDNYMYELEIV